MIKKIFIPIVLLMLVCVPMVLHAQSIGIPCTGATDCDFNKLIKLGQNIMNFLILVSFPIVVIAVAYVGILFLTSGGNSGKKDEAKEIAMKILKGFLFILTAWLIVRLITTALLDSNRYQDLLPQSAPSVMRELIPGQSFRV